MRMPILWRWRANNTVLLFSPTIFNNRWNDDNIWWEGGTKSYKQNAPAGSMSRRLCSEENCKGRMDVYTGGDGRIDAPQGLSVALYKYAYYCLREKRWWRRRSLCIHSTLFIILSLSLSWILHCVIVCTRTRVQTNGLHEYRMGVRCNNNTPPEVAYPLSWLLPGSDGQI